MRRHCTERTPARATVQARASAHPNYAAMMGGYRQVATASASRGPNPFGQEGCEDFEPQPRQNVRAATCNSFGGGSRRLGCFGTTSHLVRFVNCRMRQYYAANAIGKWVLGCAHIHPRPWLAVRPSQRDRETTVTACAKQHMGSTLEELCRCPCLQPLTTRCSCKMAAAGVLVCVTCDQ